MTESFNKKVDVSSKALEQSEELSIPRQGLTERTSLAEVVPANTLEREIEPVRDLPVASAGAIDSLLSVNLICWENDHAADGVLFPVEIFDFFDRDYDAPKRFPIPQGVDECVAGQKELAQLGVYRGTREETSRTNTNLMSELCLFPISAENRRPSATRDSIHRWILGLRS